MLESDYANELMLAKREICRLRIENSKLSAEAGNRWFLLPIGFLIGFVLAAIFGRPI